MVIAFGTEQRKVGEAGMTRLVFDDFLWFWKCEKCNGRMTLPGIAPDVKMLIMEGWKYCPHCGEQIDYDKTQTVIHKVVKWE